MRADVRVGAGAGFSGDRLDPAVQLAQHGRLDYLVFECLGERTVAAGHLQRLRDPEAGYDPLWERRARAVLPHTATAGTTVVTNSGAAHPLAAAELTSRVAKELGLDGLRIAAVLGDDVLEAVRAADPLVWETQQPLSSSPDVLLSANAYLGAEPVAQALAEEADVVVTGRVADPSLYLGPLVHEHGWSWEDHELLGRGTVVGHLLECAGQLTGGYYADPVTKPVAGLARLGFPFADVAADGSALLGKLPGTGGTLTTRTCAEQLLYEVGDPGAYLTPDVTADFRRVHFTEQAPDRVRVEGGSGTARPESLKVTLGFRGGWLGEGEISYAGPRAELRARLAGDVVRERLVAVHGLPEDAVQVDLLGTGAAFRGLARSTVEVPEVRLRIAARVPDPEAAAAVGWEVEALYTNGPAGGGGARRGAREVISVRSCLLPRELVRPRVETWEV